MKAFGKLIRSLIIVLLVGSLIVGGSYAGVFWVSRGEPDDIYLLGYAFIFHHDDEGKAEMWFVHRTKCENLDNGDGVVYFDGGYLSANTKKTVSSGDTEVEFFADSSDTMSMVEIDDENIVGEIIAVWQQK